MEQSIEVGSIWIDKSSGEYLIVKVVTVQYVRFTYINILSQDVDLTESSSSVGLFLKTKECVVTATYADKQYVQGKADGYNEGFQHGLKLGKEDNNTAYKDGIEDSFGKGYRAAVREFGEQGEEYWEDIESDEVNDSSGVKPSDVFGYEVNTVEAYGKWELPIVEAGVDIIEFDKETFDNIKSFTQVGDVGRIELFDNRSGVCGDSLTNNKGEDEKKHSHYHKSVKHLDYIDIYRVCKLFKVKDDSHCLHHSIKKLLMSGQRGAGKSKIQDITEARDTLNSYLENEELFKDYLDD